MLGEDELSWKPNDPELQMLVAVVTVRNALVIRSKVTKVVARSVYVNLHWM